MRTEDGFTTTTAEIDVRPGGVWRFVMHDPNGVDYPNKITFLELVRPERIVYLHGGREHPLVVSNGEEVQFEALATFEDHDGRALVTLQTTLATAATRLPSMVRSETHLVR